MIDTLKYRFPNSTEVVSKTGLFLPVSETERPQGFVVSDFLHDKLYLFKEQNTTQTSGFLHLNETQPTVISRRDYQLEAQAFLNSFPLLGVQKGVYSRVKQTVFDSNKTEQLFHALAQAYPKAFVYLISSELFGTWIGATPEVLMKQDEMLCNTVALAGTQTVNEEHPWADKELEEHQFVVSAIQETLERNACVEIEKNGPYEAIAGPVKHLKTDFKALLTKPNAWEIAIDLHPTPAVCGTPRNRALDAILMREMHQRELYTGFIGWYEEGKTQLFVNLRCAQIQKNKAFIYVGGGFTIDSIPDLEWEETENKAQTLLSIIKLVSE